jgi:hypothetical protein
MAPHLGGWVSVTLVLQNRLAITLISWIRIFIPGVYMNFLLTLMLGLNTATASALLHPTFFAT